MASSGTPSAPPAVTSEAVAVTEAGLGLRERKKLRTRQAIRQAAYRLIGEQGYEQTTVEQIAETAEVSPSTVFRYFATKEDIVLTDEYDPVLERAILDRPADEPPLVALREAVVGSMRLLYDDFRPEFMLRLQLVREVPALRAQMHESMDQNVELLCRVLSERTGRPRDDFELRVVVGAIFGALTEVLFDWVDRGQETDLVETVDRALEVLERGLTL